MEVKPYMLAPALNLIIAQRLVRRVCPNCVTKREANYGEKAEIEESIKKIADIDSKLAMAFDGNIPEVVGCNECNGS